MYDSTCIWCAIWVASPCLYEFCQIWKKHWFYVFVFRKLNFVVVTSVLDIKFDTLLIKKTRETEQANEVNGKEYEETKHHWNQGRSESTSNVLFEVLIINCQLDFMNLFIFNCLTSQINLLIFNCLMASNFCFLKKYFSQAEENGYL